MNSRNSLCRKPKWGSALTKKPLRRFFCAVCSGAGLLAACAAASAAPAIPGPEYPDIVKASLLIVGPGDAWYSRFGHASLRMACPRHSLDRCFTDEGEEICARPLMFLLGKLKMGMVSVPTESFLDVHRRDGRSVVRHELNLQYGEWPRFSRMTMRERFHEAIVPHPWQRFILNAIYGAVIDSAGAYERQIFLLTGPRWDGTGCLCRSIRCRC